MNSSPKKGFNDNVPEDNMELSPVLTRKRFSRRHANRKPYKRAIDTSPITSNSQSHKSPISNSHIPIPVKVSGKNVQQLNKVFDIDSSSSSGSLTNFKQDIITNCAKTVLTSNKTITSNSNKDVNKIQDQQKQQINVLRCNSPTILSKTEAKYASGDVGDDETIFEMNRVVRIPKNHLDMLYENQEYQGESKSTLGSDLSPYVSPTSKESVLSPKKNSKRQSYSSPPQCITEEDTDKEVGNPIHYNYTTDAINVSNTHAHVVNAQAQDKNVAERDCKNKVKSPFLTKDVESGVKKSVERLLLSPSLQREIQSWTEDNATHKDHLNGTFDNTANTSCNLDSKQNGGGFRGFTREDIELTERKYYKSKEYLRTFGSKKKKQKPTTTVHIEDHHLLVNKKTDCATSNLKSKPKQNEIVINGVEVNKPDESIAVSANNRVQICIGNNRIQINIKADKKSSNKVNQDPDSQATSKDIDPPTPTLSKSENTKSFESKTKSKSHGFWSLSTDDIKQSEDLQLETSDNTKNHQFNASKRMYCNLDEQLERSELKLFKVKTKDTKDFKDLPELKSLSGQTVTMNKSTIRRAEELLDEGDKIKKRSKSISFDETHSRPTKLSSINTCEYDSTSTGSKVWTTTTGSTLTTTTATMHMDTSDTSDETKISSDEFKPLNEACTGVQCDVPVHERRILKAKSFLNRYRTNDSVNSHNASNVKENFRKSLFQDCEQTNEIVEFGRVDNFNFDFKAGFATASGKTITLSPEKLKIASDKFRDLHLDGLASNVSNVSDVSGFSTAAGKNIAIDHEKLKAIATKYQDVDVGDCGNQDRSSFGGFSTATGKKLDVNQDKLQAVSNKYPELLVEGFNHNPQTKNLEVDDKKLQKVFDKYQQDNVECFGQKVNTNFDGFASAGGKKLKVNHEKLKEVSAKYQEFQVEGLNLNQNVTKPKVNNFVGFSTAGGKNLDVDQEKLQIMSAKYQQDDVECFNQKVNTNFDGFASAGGKKLKVNHEKLREVFAKYQDLDVERSYSPKNTNFGGFSSAAGKKLEVDDEKLKLASVKYQESDQNHSFSLVKPKSKQNTSGFASGSGKILTVNPDKLKAVTDVYHNLDNPNTSSTSSTKTAHELIEDVVQTYDNALKRLNSPKVFNKSDGGVSTKNDKPELTTPIKPLIASSSSSSIGRKTLGMSRITKIATVSKEQLEKARLLLEEGDKDLSITPMKSFTKTPMQTRNCAVNTPIRDVGLSDRGTCTSGISIGFGDKLQTSTPVVQRFPNARLSDISNLSTGLDYTPIKSSVFGNSSRGRSKIRDDGDEDSEELLLFRDKSCSNLRELQNDIELEYMQLKKKLDILEERKKALEHQRAVIDQCEQDHMRPRLGILSIRKKSTTSRIKLSALPSILSDHSNCKVYNIYSRIHEITPRNAEKIHFNANKNDKAVVHSTDGGKIIPNTKNTIGVTEIKNAFQAMNGIEPKLIPKGWVANHYKWIVWKLASYERRFPGGFKDCLSIDNIMQQLKYRYDREIDKANRPAIRRMMEMDDVANKRIVLCVADIVQICGNKFELILTDGWYPIRTVIDNLLSQQIYNGKLCVGTKLIIQGAELLDCEGCHPLEASEHVKLKIGYNNTRRALWHVSLGYYHIPTPFPILLRTVKPDGGQVACVKLFIVRVYPIRYMEECNGVKVWRNAKAEEKRAAEFDAVRMKELDKIKTEVYEQYESCLSSKSNKKFDKDQLKNIECPRELFQVIEASNDPETLYGLLSPSQKSALMDYKLNTASERQMEVSARIAKHVEEMKVTERYVTPLLKVLVSDALEQNVKCMVLNVWNPTEEQMQLIQEEACLSIYNVGVKRTHELNTLRRSMFRLHEGIVNKQCQRQVLPISLTTDAYYKPMFNEFDTIGVIIEFSVREFDQEIWLSDFVGRLLYIKIVDGPKHCSLLDTAKPGQTVVFSNLIMHLPHSDFGQCMANQYTWMSQFPQNKCFQQGLELFNSQVTDVGKLVNDCKLKIETMRAHVNVKSNNQDYALLHKSKPNLFEDSTDENATIPSRLTMIDVAMSLIDTESLIV